MEIINKTTQYETPVRRQEYKLYIGIVLVLAGILWTLYNFDVISYAFFTKIFSWPVLVTICGGYLLSLRRWYSGAIVTATGLIFLAIRTLHLHVSIETGCGIILIIYGIALIIASFRKKS